MFGLLSFYLRMMYGARGTRFSFFQRRVLSICSPTRSNQGQVRQCGRDWILSPVQEDVSLAWNFFLRILPVVHDDQEWKLVSFFSPSQKMNKLEKLEHPQIFTFSTLTSLTIKMSRKNCFTIVMLWLFYFLKRCNGYILQEHWTAWHFRPAHRPAPHCGSRLVVVLFESGLNKAEGAA